MYLTIPYIPNAPGWAWEDSHSQATAGNVALGNYYEYTYDIMVDTNYPPGYSGIGQGYLDFAMVHDGTFPPLGETPNSLITYTNGWQNFTGYIPGAYGVLNAFDLWFNSGGWNNSPQQTVAYWIDAIRLIAAPANFRPNVKVVAPAPTPGLNIWANGTGQFTRYGIYTPSLYAWVFNTPVSYSFTVAQWPTNFSGDTNNPGDESYALNMTLVGGTGGNSGSPDWTYGSVVFMQLGCNTNGVANWIFRWKTNWPGSNGNGNNAGPGYFFQPDLPNLTNSTPIGTWTLTFNTDNNVTMTSPSGSSTNFTLGALPDTSDLSLNSDFQSGLSVSLNLMPDSTNDFYKKVVISRCAVWGAGIAGFTNDWTTSYLNTNLWNVDAMLAQSSCMVVTNGTYALSWNTPDNGFFLQTNNVVFNKNATITNYWYDYTGTNITQTNYYIGGWTTNGVPQAINLTTVPGNLSRYGFLLATTNRYTFIPPDTFPLQRYRTGNLLFRTCKPGF